MNIGITINNLLRDHISEIKKMYSLEYDKDPIEPINPFDLEKSFPPIESSEIVDEFTPIIDEAVYTDLTENVKDEGFDVYSFIYNNAAFEIFGRSQERIDGMLMRLKSLEEKLKFKFILLNKESPRSKCATLFFLSKNNFEFKTLHFPTNEKDFWRSVDALVTDNPKILEVKPVEKISIKVLNEYNKDIPSDYTITNFNDTKELRWVLNLIRIKNIKKRKTKKGKK